MATSTRALSPSQLSPPPAARRASLWLHLGLGATVGLVAWLYDTLSPSRAPARPPTILFENAACEAGIEFVHNKGAQGDALRPETMGSGVAIFDFDGDGSQDLLFANSTYWPWEQGSAMEQTTPALYRNDGSGRFEDVTAGSGLDVGLFGMGVATADYDNDGRPDVFLTAVGENRLYRNLGDGAFEDVTKTAGVAGEANAWSASAAWADLDNDGLLDLFVCNYVRWPEELGLELAFKLSAIGRGYGPRVNFTGAFCKLYLNSGDGTFADVSASSGVEILDPETGFPKGRSLAVAPIDLDEDGLLDLVVANHSGSNFVFRNLGGARFEEIGDADRASGDGPGFAMGIDAARLRDREAPGIAVGSFANELNGIYFSASDSLVFAEDALAKQGSAAEGLQRFGLFFFDFDLDGRLDLLTVNGYLEEEINQIDSADAYARPAGLYWNAGDGLGDRFVAMDATHAGDDLFRPVVGRGAAYGDLDGDGDLDVVITQNGGPPLLLRNESELDRSWLRVKLVGARSNRDGIGATVEVEVGTRLLQGAVMPTRSYLSQSELPVTFGLGRATRVRRVTVRWPSGEIQTLEDLPVNATVVAREDGRAVAIR